MERFTKWTRNPITWIAGAVMCIVGVLVWAIRSSK